jgi:hypothetical protein
MTRVGIAFVVLASLVPLRADAHDVDADTLIGRGLELRRAGNSTEALELFQRAHRAAPSPRTFGQMGLVETSLAHWSEAETHLLASLATPQDGWVQKNRPFLEQALDKTKDHLGELVVSGRPGTKVFVAGKVIGTLPLAAPVRVVEGDFPVTATADTFKPFLARVSVKGGARTAITIVLEPVDVASPLSPVSEPPTAAEPPRGSLRRWTGAALAVAGAGALAWGVTWIALDSRESCGSLQAGACQNVYDTKTAGWILTAGGSALALTGGVILFSSLHTAKPDLAFGITPKSFLLQAHF